MTKKIVGCKKNKNHFYPYYLKECPWCKIYQDTGKDPFDASIKPTKYNKKSHNTFPQKYIQNTNHSYKKSSSFNTPTKQKRRGTKFYIKFYGFIFTIIFLAIFNNPFYSSNDDYLSDKNIQSSVSEPKYYEYPEGFVTAINKKYDFDSRKKKSTNFVSHNYPQVIRVNYEPDICKVDKVRPNQPSTKTEFVKVSRPCQESMYRIIIKNTENGNEYRMGLVDYSNGEKIFLDSVRITESGNFNIEIEGESSSVQLLVEIPGN